MEAKDGSFGFDFEAIYDEVKVGESFTYTLTLDDSRKVTVNFVSKNNDTEIIIIFDAETENLIDLQKQGWQTILNNFKKYTDGN
jgi:hypothetical protein